MNSSSNVDAQQTTLESPDTAKGESFLLLSHDSPHELVYLSMTDLGIYVQPHDALRAPFLIACTPEVRVSIEVMQDQRCLTFRANSHALFFAAASEQVQRWAALLLQQQVALSLPPPPPPEPPLLHPRSAHTSLQSSFEYHPPVRYHEPFIMEDGRSSYPPSRFLSAVEALSPHQPRQARVEAQEKLSASSSASKPRPKKPDQASPAPPMKKAQVASKIDVKSSPQKPETPPHTTRRKGDEASRESSTPIPQVPAKKKTKSLPSSPSPLGKRSRAQQAEPEKEMSVDRAAAETSVVEEVESQAQEPSSNGDVQSIATTNAQQVKDATMTDASLTSVDGLTKSPAQKGKYWSVDEKAKEAMQQEGKRVTRGEVKRLLSPATPPSTEPSEKCAQRVRGQRVKKPELVLSTATVYPINELPGLLQEILNELPKADLANYDMFELQNLLITSALDEATFTATDSDIRSQIKKACLETVLADTTNRFVKGTKKGRVDLNVVGEHDLAMLQRYNAFLNSPEQQALRQAYRGGMYRRLWTKEELQKFEEALKLFPPGPGSTRKIAAYIGGSITQRNVVYLKKQRKMKMRRLGLNKETVDPSQAVAALSSLQVAVNNVDLDNPETWIGKRVRVWFANRRKYYIGTVLSCDYKSGEFTVDWGKGEVTTTELLKQNNTTLTSNPDRWTFCFEDATQPTTPAAAAGGSDGGGIEEKKQNGDGEIVAEEDDDDVNDDDNDMIDDLN